MLVCKDNFYVQLKFRLMATGVRGHHMEHVPKHVEVALKPDREDVTIQLHLMAAEVVVEVQLKEERAIPTPVQV